ncbi:MAG: UDP-N-acetylmuramoyl-L-alanine--D-glutamate ligase [Planctomycetota bacterium]
MSAPLAVVVGLGRFGGGVAAARFLAGLGYRLRVVDKATADSLRESVEALAGLPVDWRLGGEDPATLDGTDLCVLNPAIPNAHPLAVAARTRGMPITQEAALFLEHYPGRVVVVTGTNGKSSTTMLLGQALRAGGLDVIVGGNLGNSLLDDAERWHRDQCAVLEISSFQLERLAGTSLRVEGAVFAPVTRDHLDRHGSLAAYHDAKSVAATMADEFCVVDATDPVACEFATTARHRLRHSIAGPRDGAHAWLDDDGWLTLGIGDDPGRLCHSDAMLLDGKFQRGNALAAALAAHCLGAPRARIGLGLALARPLPFRLQRLGKLRGVIVYDNAVSTAVESTLSALETLVGRVHWVGGGKSKDGDDGYRATAAALAGRIESAALFGAAAPLVTAELRARGVIASAHDTLEDALNAALERAREGDILLFSPAFASFDQFANFRARAQRFHGWWRARQ